MAHNLNDGRMFYTGETPWHKLGVKLDNPATSAEAIAAARLDYKVVLKELQTVDGVRVPEKFATVRLDNNTPLGVVGSYYEPVQNVEAFDFFDGVVGEKLAMYHTAGALGLGERIWVLAQLPRIIQVTNKDTVEKYLLLTNSHDGLSSLRMFFTPVRVVCQNTLNAALSSVRSGISIRHTGNIKYKLNEARRALGIAQTFYSEFEQAAVAFKDKKLNVNDTNAYFLSLLMDKEETEVTTRTANKMDELLGLFEHGRGNAEPEVKHSLWSAYNAVTEWTDHYKSVKNDSPSNRLESVWFGGGAEMKIKAYNTALAML